MHVNTLDRHIKAGRLPAHKIGRSVRINRAELDAVLMAGCLK
ncbi:helix-turn-helix domain-containing protein [Aquicoccus sp. SCR17]|nr:helix-turn-helix domain-containing protein [Carideicomes alvinocaridis]